MMSKDHFKSGFQKAKMNKDISIFFANFYHFHSSGCDIHTGKMANSEKNIDFEK